MGVRVEREEKIVLKKILSKAYNFQNSQDSTFIFMIINHNIDINN